MGGIVLLLLVKLRLLRQKKAVHKCKNTLQRLYKY